MSKNVGKTGWSQRYRTALRKHLAQDKQASLLPAEKLGRQAVSLGMETLDVAKIHGHDLPRVLAPAAPRARQRLTTQAKKFFAETIVPIEATHGAARNAEVRTSQLNQTLRRRTKDSEASARHLARSITRRQASEAAVIKSGEKNARLLTEAHGLQRNLQRLTRASLSTREAERQKISRRLYDDVAQALVAIDVRLLAVKTSARANTKILKKKIVDTQRLVQKSKRKVNRFAHECAQRRA